MMQDRIRRRRAAAIVLAALCTWAGSGLAATDLHLLELSPTRPPCSPAADMPVVPDDPGAITDSGGRRRCYGTRPPVLSLKMPDGRWLWLEGADTSPAAWVAVGPVLVDPDEIETPALGLRLSAGSGGPVLESRYDDRGTMTPLRAGAWQEVRLADGRRLWIRLREPEGWNE
jgi:hypothetical protein